jgi:hypothetical protein
MFFELWSIVTRIIAGRSRVRIPVGATDIFLFFKTYRQTVGPPNLSFSRFRDSFPGGKPAGAWI